MIDLLTLFSLIILPLVGLMLFRNATIANYLRVIIWLILFFITHNILFFCGYSLRGDDIDYVIFSLEYPVVLLTIILAVKIRTNIYTKILKKAGLIIMVLGMFWGIVSAISIISSDMEYVSDQQYHFTANNKTYEVRRYSFGFATLINTRYTFETYQTFKYLSIEHLLDRTVLFDDKVKFNINDDLKFDVRSKKGMDTLVFKSREVDVFKKKLP